MVYNMAKLFRLRLFGRSGTRWMGRITLPHPENSEDHTWLITRAIPAPYANKNSKKQMISLSARTAAHRTTANAGKRSVSACIRQTTPPGLNGPRTTAAPITRWAQNTATTAAFRCRTTRITCSTSRITPPPAATARCTPTAATRPTAPRSIARHRAKNRHPTRTFSVQAAWGRMALPARKSAPMTRLTASRRGTGPAMLGRPAFII